MEDWLEAEREIDAAAPEDEGRKQSTADVERGSFTALTGTHHGRGGFGLPPPPPHWIRHTAVYGYPGDGINGILGALDRAQDTIDFVQVRHEVTAVFMACAHATFTGEVRVCLATSGPAAIHLLNGPYDARLDHQPVVAIVGQQARAALGGQYQQEVDRIRRGMMASLSGTVRDRGDGRIWDIRISGSVTGRCFDRYERQPVVTIMALACRIGDRMIAKARRGELDERAPGETVPRPAAGATT